MGKGLASILCSALSPADATLWDMKPFLHKRLTWDMASLGAVAQDLEQVPCIRRKQGVRPWPLMTEGFMQVLHLQHQIKAALPALPQTPLREAPSKGLGLLEHFLAWVPHVIFHHFPLLQEHPDFRLSPWAI